MATPILQVDIADLSRLVFSGPCRSLVAPAAHGEVCIMPRHAPLLTLLKPGVVNLLSDEGERQSFFVSGGFLEVQANTATVLADQMLRSAEIDREAAEQARKAAEQLLKVSLIGSEREKAMFELARAMAQLRALEMAEADRLKRHKR